MSLVDNDNIDYDNKMYAMLNTHLSPWNERYIYSNDDTFDGWKHYWKVQVRLY